MRTITLLPVEEFKFLKVLQIEGPDYHRFTAYLPYIRTFDEKKYVPQHAAKDDLLDEQILATIQSVYPDTRLRYSRSIFFEGELEETLKAIAGGTIKPCTIQFNPHITYEVIARSGRTTFSAYPFSFQLRVHLSPEHPRLEAINDYFLCQLPLEQLDGLAKTIKPI